MGLVFEDPPPSRQHGPRTNHAHVAAALKAQPGRWAVVSVHGSPPAANTAACRIKSALTAAYQPARSFEAVARTVDGECRVYARYVGESSDDR